MDTKFHPKGALSMPDPTPCVQAFAEFWLSTPDEARSFDLSEVTKYSGWSVDDDRSLTAALQTASQNATVNTEFTRLVAAIEQAVEQDKNCDLMAILAVDQWYDPKYETHAKVYAAEVCDWVEPVATPAPTITSITPNAGVEAGGIEVTIVGTGFTAGVKVTFDGVSATEIVLVSETELKVKTPPHAEGVVAVEVANLDGQKADSSFAYTKAVTLADPPPPDTRSDPPPDTSGSRSPPRRRSAPPPPDDADTTVVRTPGGGTEIRFAPRIRVGGTRIINRERRERPAPASSANTALDPAAAVIEKIPWWKGPMVMFAAGGVAVGTIVSVLAAVIITVLAILVIRGPDEPDHMKNGKEVAPTTVSAPAQPAPASTPPVPSAAPADPLPRHP